MQEVSRLYFSTLRDAPLAARLTVLWLMLMPVFLIASLVYLASI